MRRAAAGGVRNRRGVAALEGPARLRTGRPPVHRPGRRTGFGLVSLDDNRGAYHRLAGTAAAATALTLVAPPVSGTFGETKTVTAALTGPGGAPLAGKTVTVSVGGGSTQLGVTGADGRVTLGLPLSTAPGNYQLVGSFGGDTTHAPSSDSEPFAIAKAQASLSAFTQLPVVTGGGATGLTSTLTAALGGEQQPLLQLTVTYTLTGPGGTKTFSTITDYLGRATLPPVGLAAGTYAVSASFAGDATYTGATRTGTLVVSTFSGFFPPVANPPTVNIAKAGSAIPVKFSLGGNRGLRSSPPGYPRVVTTVCGTGVPTQEIKTTVTAGGSSLTYDAGSNKYQYTWKTEKGWTGCRRLELEFVDGTIRFADFKFK